MIAEELIRAPLEGFAAGAKAENIDDYSNPYPDGTLAHIAYANGFFRGQEGRLKLQFRERTQELIREVRND